MIFLLNVMLLKKLPFSCFNHFVSLMTLHGTWNIGKFRIAVICPEKDSLLGQVLVLIRPIGFILQLHSTHRVMNVFIYRWESKSSCDARNVSSYHLSTVRTCKWPCLNVTGLVQKCKPVISTMMSVFYETTSDHLVLTATHLLVKSGGKRIDGYSNCVLVAFML